MKIVIVDDSLSIRKVLRAICEDEGHEVIAEFGDGEGVLDFLSSHRPDVVCLDYELPGVDGLELLVEMDTSANQVDVVMITGSKDPELKGHAADFGARGFIQKPFQQAQVIGEFREIEKARTIAAQTASREVAEPTATPVVGDAAVSPEIVAESGTTEVAETADTPEATETGVPPVATPSEGIGVTPRSAVIIDDSGAIRLLLKGILQEIGIKVVGLAANGGEGIEVVKRTRPAVVCLDVEMPGMSGIEALPRVRAASPETMVVMITGNATRAVVEAAAAGGARGYFLKPVRPAKVEEFMRKLLLN